MKRNQGFTLLELIIIITIIGIIILISMSIIYDFQEKGLLRKLREDINDIEQAKSKYILDMGVIPELGVSGIGDGTMWTNASNDIFVKGSIRGSNTKSNIEKWKGPYIPKWPEAPLGGEYVYVHYAGSNLSRSWASNWQRHNNSSIKLPNNEAVEMVIIRYNHLSDANKRKELRDKSIEYLLRVVNSESIFVVNSSIDGNDGMVGIRIK